MPDRDGCASAANDALHAHALQALVAADMALAHAPALDLAEPHTLDALSREWLEATLGNRLSGARLEALHVDDAHDGMTSRKKWRLDWNDAGRAAGLPGSVFVKATPPSPHNREMLAVLHMAEIETLFYRQIQPALPELAPQAYHAASYPGGRFLILLEDLAARDLRPYWLADECDVAHARAVAAALARLHATYWASERFSGDLVWLRPRTLRFGHEWLDALYRGSRRSCLDSAPELALPEDMRALLRQWDAGDRQIYAYWDRMPPTVLHGDSHLGNTFAYPDGRAGLFDWQVMYRGPGLRDLSYFLLSALPNALRETHERGIFELYLESLAAGGVRLDPESAWNDYCLFAFEQLDANIVTLAQGGYGHADVATRRAMDSTIGAIRQYDVAGRLDQVLRRECR